MRLPHLRPFAHDPLYFLTACTDNRRPVLSAARACAILRDVWTRSAEIDGWFVGRFVLMPDHVHFFARPARDAKSCAQWMKTWKSVSARRITAALGLSPPIWQPDYFDHFVRSAEAYSEKWDYVWHNPVRQGFVSRPEDWPWQGVIHDLQF
ncbi:MAG TPA: transposase [Opitutus sp.]|nr:transposase [Opitutus sp.]